MPDLIIKGAKQNNLKNIDVVIPDSKVTAVVGPSGSGKSSLVFYNWFIRFGQIVSCF